MLGSGLMVRPLVLYGRCRIHDSDVYIQVVPIFLHSSMYGKSAMYLFIDVSVSQ
jgi:hypothetical protein